MANEEIEKFQKEKFVINFRRVTSTASPMKETLKERKQLQNAFGIIAKSFTYGAKLQRDPVSEEEKRR